MASPVSISRSVGRRGSNLPADVLAIGAALTEIGPDRGGIFAPPLSIDGLGQAIEQFQRFHSLPIKDGRVDPGGNTLRRMNAILAPSPAPTPPGPLPPPPIPGGSGTVRPIQPAGAPTSVGGTAFTPVPRSLETELVFQWGPMSGNGTVHYFELDQNVVPNWFGVVVPSGVTPSGRVHLFFHPTPAQAGFKDANYPSKTGWVPLFHYMSDLMSRQFCGAGTDRILIMPLMTQGSAGDCGILPAMWEAIFAQILGLLAAGGGAGMAAPQPVTSLVVSSFSAGIAYSHVFRARARLAGRLAGIIDFDGAFSTNRALSAALGSVTTVPVIRFQQGFVSEAQLPALAARNIFPVPRPRWGEPFAASFPVVKPENTVHGFIPHTMMHFAASRIR